MTKKYCLLLLLTAIAAIVLRLPCLDKRPMHTDEAVHAVKFGQLLEDNSYQYNPKEYHGPTLNYFSLIPAWLTGTKKYSDLNEYTLRIVPVFFGILLVLMPFLIIRGLSKGGVIMASVLTALSPAFVFYSRYYIQEMLLVSFTFVAIVCGYRYTKDMKISWAILTGVFLGLMHATKETCIITFASLLLALLLTMLIRQKQDYVFANIKNKIKFHHIIFGLLAAVIVSALFYSSFLKNPCGVRDSIRAYLTYFSKSAHNQWHIHPWYYYFQLLIYSKHATGPIWSEVFIVLLAVVGIVVAFTKRAGSIFDITFVRFLAFYTVIMTIAYCAIPYKTPWSMLSFFHGMILLAAIGAVALVRLFSNVLARSIIICLLAAGCAHLVWQSYTANYKYFADPRNPYVYAHTTTDVFEITRKVENIAGVHPDKYNMYLQVICPDDDYWPLPWYLRRFSNVGYWNHVDFDVPAAELVIASPDIESELLKKFYEQAPAGEQNLYVPLFDTHTELRPGVEIRGYVIKELRDMYQQQQGQGTLKNNK